MKKLFTLFISIAACAIAYSQTPVSGNISTNTTWSDPSYQVTGNVSVDAGVTLTIDPGVIVYFDNSRSLFSYGTINATTVTFTSINGSPSIGDWNFIRFYSGGSGTLNGCTVQYGDYIDIQDGANVTIENSSIIELMYYYGINNEGTLNFDNSAIDLTGYVSYGYGIYTGGTSTTNLTGLSTISNCNSGIYILSEGSDVNLTSCILSANDWPVFIRSLGDITTGPTSNFTGNTQDAFYVYPTTMSKNWTMPYVNVPYYFRDNFAVNNTFHLIIEEENIIKFPLHRGLEIYGRISANAGIGQNIYFTSERDDNWGGDTNNDGAATAPAASNWYGIRFFDNSNDLSILRRCQIRYAGYNNLGGVSLYDASPIIEYCELQQNYFGAYFQNASSPTFNFNTVGSSQKTPIAMSFEANPSFIDNVLSFMDNEYDAIGLLGGTLTADAYIVKRDFTTVTNVTYVMLAQITVPNGRLLDIEEGVVIKSPTHNYRLLIYGKLVCDGSLGSITFTSVKDDNFGNPGDTNKDGTITTPAINDMGAIIFEDGHDPTSLLDNVLMKYASVYNWSYPNGGSNHYMNASAIAVRSAAPAPAGPTIQNCEFRELTYGISCYQTANPIISSNSMVNVSQTPFAIAAASNPSFSGNSYTNCGLNALGLIGHNVVNNGTIIKRTVAGYTNITYVLLEDITIVNSTLLSINPGVVIKMSTKRWYVDGGLAFNGTVAEHVTFTSFKDDNVGNPMDTNGDGNASSPTAGDWYNIEYRESSDDVTSVINYTDFQYGGYSNQGMVRWTNAAANMNNTVIDRSNSFGLWINGDSDPTIDNVSIQNCSSDPIAMSLTSNPTFTNISFAANLSNGIFLIEGLAGYSLSTTTTLSTRSLAGFANIPYIADDLLINSGAILTLEPGIIMKFRGSYFIGTYVHGGLNATGLPGQKIIFTSIRDDSAGGDTNNDGSSTIPGNNDWTGLIYYEESIDASNILEYCELRYTGGGYTNAFGTNTIWGAVRIKDAKVTVNETVFQQGYGNAFGIFGTADPVITNCNIFNFTQEPVYMAMFANPTFSGNTVANVGKLAIGIQPETYSQTATFIQRDFAGYSNITYMFYGATVNSGTTITIPAGTIFKSTSNPDFVVNGKLEIAGSSGNEVIFTDYRDDAHGNPSDTEQNGSATTPTTYGAEILFNDVSDDLSYVDYTNFRYSQYPIQLFSASPIITNNLFYKSLYGISNNGVCTPIVDDNTFEDLTYAPLAISLVAYPASTSGNLITGTTFKVIRVNNETLTSDQTLPKRSFGGVDNIPYFFDDYTIGTGVTLTIDPGVICKFWNTGSMAVNNGLIAEGNPVSGEYIVFTSITDDFYGGDSNSDGTVTPYDGYTWYGITINDVALNPLCRFENCIFRWAKYSTGYGIKTISSSPSILNCSFNNCDYGVYAQAASNPTINFCDFYNITNMGVYNVNESFVIDAENNWWGSNTGPTHTGNPGGIGVPVSDAVDYDPYGTSLAINPLLGDVSLNSIIQAFDATKILLWVANPGANPLTLTQLNVADVSGAAGVTAFDASQILQYVVGLISYFPAALLNPAPNVVSEVELDIANANVNPGDEFVIPVSISDVSGVYSMQMNIQYDPEFLTALEIENQLSQMNIASHIDPESGLISVAFAGIESLESDLTIANITFKATENVGLATETEIEAEFFMANETDLSWNVHNGIVMINGLSTGLIDQNSSDQIMFCYPNPFTDQLTIDYNVQHDGDNVSIAVYDLFGKLVAEIVNGNHASETYKLRWNGTDANGSNLKNGIYFLRFTSGETSITKKIQIVR